MGTDRPSARARPRRPWLRRGRRPGSCTSSCGSTSAPVPLGWAPSLFWSVVSPWASGPPLGLAVELIGALQAEKHEFRHKLVELPLILEHPRETPSPDDVGPLSAEDLPGKPRDDVPDRPRVAVVEAGLDALDGRAT